MLLRHLGAMAGAWQSTGPTIAPTCSIPGKDCSSTTERGFLLPEHHNCLLSRRVLQDILIGQAKFVDNHTIKYGLPGRVDVGGQVTAKDVIIATGSVPFVPPGAPSV
jgi:hypothetical protein